MSLQEAGTVYGKWTGFYIAFSTPLSTQSAILFASFSHSYKHLFSMLAQYPSIFGMQAGATRDQTNLPISSLPILPPELQSQSKKN